MVSLWAEYKRIRYVEGGMLGHCVKLRRMAKECSHATEFGARRGVSTICLLAGSVGGKLKRLVSYDVRPTGSIRKLAPTIFRFIHGDSLEVDIEPTDLLMIDAVHTREHLLQELNRHCDQVRKWIVMHDTVTSGVTGDDGRPGLLSAIDSFLASHSEWGRYRHYNNSHGLTILKRGEL